MAKIIGVLASERIVAGLVEGNRVTGRVHVYPEPDSDAEGRSNVAAESTDAMRPNVHTAEGVAEVYTRLAAAQERHKSSKHWWTDEQLDYLIAIHTEDFSRTNDELACMCGERFGREVNKNMVTGKLNTLRKAGHTPRYRPGHERKPAAEKETPETATSLPE